MKTALFKFEASSELGAGHAIRSSVIADTLVGIGWKCKLVTSLSTMDFIPDLKQYDRIDPEHYITNTIASDLLVIDDYTVDEQYEQKVRCNTKKIMVIDDLANRRHDCDILLDQAYERKAHDYVTLVPNSCKILTGSKYCLLRNKFTNLRDVVLDKRRNTKKISQVLISMGGGNSIYHIKKIVNMIKQAQIQTHLNIVLGFTNKFQNELEQYLNQLGVTYTVYVNPDIAELIINSDVAIGAGGSSVWERCCLGLPSFLVRTAENQDFFLSKLKKHFTILDLDSDIITNKFKDQVKNIEQDYYKYAKIVFELIDGQGVKRVMEHII